MELISKLLFQVIAADAANVMASCYGSHVLRTLLCLCKGVPLESLQDFHTTKRSAVLAERLSCGKNQSGGHDPRNFEYGFSDMFKSFVREMLHNAKADIAALRVDKNSSLVLQVSVHIPHSIAYWVSILTYDSALLQTALKLSCGDDNELHYIISILLGYDEHSTVEKRDYSEKREEIVTLLDESAFSHLLEVFF